MNSKKKFTLTAVLLLIGFVPLILSGIVICLLTARTVSNSLEEATYQKLKVTTDALRKYYQYDLDMGNDIPYEHDYVDMLKGDDIEMTVFVQDVRYMTSTYNDNGKRNEGTKMDSAIWSRVKSGESVTAKGVHVGDRKYFVYYMPLRNGSNQVVGAAWCGQPEDKVNANIRNVVFGLVAVVAVAVVIFAAVILAVLVLAKPQMEIEEGSLGIKDEKLSASVG